jgi:carbonyl reductase 1
LYRNNNQVRYAQIDITSKISISNFISATLHQNPAIHILINNAAIALTTYDLSTTTQMLDVNYRSTRQTCELFLSVGKMSSTPKARIVNISATQLRKYSPIISSQLHNVNLTFSELDEMVSTYISVVKAGQEAESGWNHIGASYSVSKAFLNAATTILARENPGVLINCCCPGWVATDMGRLGGEGGKKPADGAKIPVHLAVGNIGSVSGKFWSNSTFIDTGNGEVKDW